MASVARCVSEQGPVFAPPRGEGNEHAFVEALKRQDRSVQLQFYGRYADLVERIVARIVGVDDDLPDLRGKWLHRIHDLDRELQPSSGWQQNDDDNLRRSNLRRMEDLK